MVHPRHAHVLAHHRHDGARKYVVYFFCICCCTLAWTSRWKSAFFFTIYLFCVWAEHAYNDATLWCWIQIFGDNVKNQLWKLFCLYLWVLLGAISMAVLLIRVKMDMKKRLQG